MARYAGDCQAVCGSCAEYVEFALGVRAQHEPTAMFFAPGGPRNVPIRDLQLALMTDDAIDVRFQFQCPLCENWTAGRASCQAV